MQPARQCVTQCMTKPMPKGPVLAPRSLCISQTRYLSNALHCTAHLRTRLTRSTQTLPQVRSSKNTLALCLHGRAGDKPMEMQRNYQDSKCLWAQRAEKRSTAICCRSPGIWRGGAAARASGSARRGRTTHARRSPPQGASCSTRPGGPGCWPPCTPSATRGPATSWHSRGATPAQRAQALHSAISGAFSSSPPHPPLVCSAHGRCTSTKPECNCIAAVRAKGQNAPAPPYLGFVPSGLAQCPLSSRPPSAEPAHTSEALLRYPTTCSGT